MSSSKTGLKKPSHRNKSINAMTSSSGKTIYNDDEDNAIDASAPNIFTTDIDLNQRVNSVIQHDNPPSSDESSIDDYEMHRDGFAYGDFDHMVAFASSTDDHSIDLDHHIAAVSMSFLVSINNISESSSDSDTITPDFTELTITLDGYVDRLLEAVLASSFYADGMDSSLDHVDEQS